MTSSEQPIDPRVTHEILPGDLNTAKQIEANLEELRTYERLLQEKMMEATKDHTDQGQREWMGFVDALENVRRTIVQEKRELKRHQDAALKMMEGKEL